MLRSGNIKNTFKKNLFKSLPPLKPRIYRILQESIFPGKSDFINFLNEKNYEKTVDYAKKILLRLDYELSFSTPTRLIFNIIDVETKQVAYDSKNGFISRDHFVHLIHLYLLGIYIFFYHKGIHCRIYEKYVGMKRKWCKENFLDISDNLLSEKEIIDDFVFTWKLFILNHDVGYPFEILTQV